MAKSAVKYYAMYGVGQGAGRVPGADMSTDQISDVSNVERQDNIEILVSWSGTTPVGTISIERSSDNIDWRALDFGSGNTTPISGNTGSHEFYINQLGTPLIRCSYVSTSGTGTIYASISTKSLSGGAG